MRLLVAVSVFILGLSIVPLTYAASSDLTCPSVSDVKHLNNIWPHGSWLPLYVENGELASEADIEKFSKTTTQFTVAEWSGDFSEAGHCSYSGTDPVVEKIVLARDMLKPKPDAEHWELIAHKTFGCFGPNPEICIFGGAG